MPARAVPASGALRLFALAFINSINFIECELIECALFHSVLFSFIRHLIAFSCLLLFSTPFIPLGPSVRLQLISFINYINSIHSLFHTSLFTLILAAIMHRVGVEGVNSLIHFVFTHFIHSIPRCFIEIHKVSLN